MSILDSFRTALASLTDNKLRSMLTLLGVVIGVGAVIAVMSIGEGSSASITRQIESIGTNLVFVRPAPIRDQNVRGAAGSGFTLTLADAAALGQEGSEAIEGVAPEVSTFAQVRGGSENFNTRVLGTTPDYGTIRNRKIADGQFISQQDVDARTSVVVLGSRVADTLFQGADPIGQTVMINQRPFRVIGLLQPVGGSALGTEDDIIIAPITTVQTRVIRNRSAQGSDFVQLINVKAASEKQVDAVKQEVADILRVRHRITGEDDFSLTSQDDIAQTRQEVNDVLTIFLASIAGISLLVGGIGIMNIMLVSVTERTREIGIRKAIGAKRRDIMAQFLGEATLLSLGGGGIGLAAGWGVSGMLEKVTLNNQRIETLITPEIIILSVGVAVAVGVFFGIYPALRASRLDPIEALRR